MSLRPRFAGDGLLVLPSDVRVVRTPGRARAAGDVLSALDGERVDPFERDADDILLAEAFARVDLSRPRLARDWYLAHGAVALRWLFPDTERPLDWVGLHLTAQDSHAEVLAHQRLVRWHLTSLARLTAHRPAAASREHWDSAWSSALLEGPEGHRVWVGAPPHAAAALSPLDSSADVPADLPRLAVPEDAWTRYWVHYDLPVPEPETIHRRLESDRDGLLEVQRRLIEPYVQSAVATDVRLERLGEELAVRETRVWGSILVPIYLQLLEALRRVSEGKPGATWCRECGQVFLTLDARRSAFCTDRERMRFAQRVRARTLASAR